jgi:hypothetical protein
MAVLIDDVTDLHVHAAPSLVPRHRGEAEMHAAHQAIGVSLSVLKAHEGSTVERAAVAGEGVVGGVVLNSPVGGINPDAVEVAARLGGRIVWMPSVSAPAHQKAHANPELALLKGMTFREVRVLDDDGALLPSCHDVLDVVAAHDLVLASGHLTAAEAVTVFRAAREHGVKRLLMNHPLLAFLEWSDDYLEDFKQLGARLELGIIPDLLPRPDGRLSVELPKIYPSEMLVFGGDTGHADYPRLEDAFETWIGELEKHAGPNTEAILTSNGRELIAK